jgi:hypothetical protein
MLGIWRLLGCLAIDVVTTLTELFRLPSAVRRNRIMCSKYVTSVDFGYSCVCTRKQSPDNSVPFNCTNCWKNTYESAVVTWLCWRNIISRCYLTDAENIIFFDFATAKLGTCRCLTHWGRVTQICVFTLQLCKMDYKIFKILKSFSLQ